MKWKSESLATTFTNVDYTSGHIVMTVAKLPFSEPNKKYKLTLYILSGGGVMAPFQDKPSSPQK